MRAEFFYARVKKKLSPLQRRCITRGEISGAGAGGKAKKGTVRFRVALINVPSRIRVQALLSPEFIHP